LVALVPNIVGRAPQSLDRRHTRPTRRLASWSWCSSLAWRVNL